MPFYGDRFDQSFDAETISVWIGHQTRVYTYSTEKESEKKRERERERERRRDLKLK